MEGMLCATGSKGISFYGGPSYLSPTRSGDPIFAKAQLISVSGLLGPDQPPKLCLGLSLCRGSHETSRQQVLQVKQGAEQPRLGPECNLHKTFLIFNHLWKEINISPTYPQVRYEPYPSANSFPPQDYWYLFCLLTEGQWLP